MTNKEFAALARALVPELPGGVVKAPLVFMSPVGHTLRGLCFESHSSEPRWFYLWAFFLPLFVPREHVSFEFGERIGGGYLDADDPDTLPRLRKVIERTVSPHLSSIVSPADVARIASDAACRAPANLHLQHAAAYAFARAGDRDRAVDELRRLAGSLDLQVSWQREMADRAALLSAKLLADPMDAQRQLDAWQAVSAGALGLVEFVR